MALGNKEWILHFEKNARILECRSLESQILEIGKTRIYVFETPSILKGEESGVANVFIYEKELYIEWVRNGKVAKSFTVPGTTTVFYENDKLRITTQRVD